MALGNVEDEHTFSNLSFMKNRFLNHLIMHLNLVVRIYAQKFYSVDTFPFYIAICAWNDDQVRYEVEI
jgi:hypothetical protein